MNRLDLAEARRAVSDDAVRLVVCGLHGAVQGRQCVPGVLRACADRLAWLDVHVQNQKASGRPQGR